MPCQVITMCTQSRADTAVLKLQRDRGHETHQKGNACKGETSLATLEQGIDRFPKSLRFLSEKVVPVCHSSHEVKSSCHNSCRGKPLAASPICCDLLLLGIEKLGIGLDMHPLEFLSICNKSKLFQKLHFCCLLQALI